MLIFWRLPFLHLRCFTSLLFTFFHYLYPSQFALRKDLPLTYSIVVGVNFSLSFLSLESCKKFVIAYVDRMTHFMINRTMWSFSSLVSWCRLSFFEFILWADSIVFDLEFSIFSSCRQERSFMVSSPSKFFLVSFVLNSRVPPKHWPGFMVFHLFTLGLYYFWIVYSAFVL